MPTVAPTLQFTSGIAVTRLNERQLRNVQKPPARGAPSPGTPLIHRLMGTHFLGLDYVVGCVGDNFHFFLRDLNSYALLNPSIESRGILMQHAMAI